MILVDTSVWIETFRRRGPLQLTRIISFDDIVTCLPVIQEVLQGFPDESAFRVAHDAMFALPTVDSPMPPEVFEDAIRLYRTTRKKGLTVRSSVDCLIAASAIRHNLTVLHKDRDFPLLARFSSLSEQAL